MKILLVKPNEFAVEAEIESGLKAAQKVVGGHIEVYSPNADPVGYVLNEEGKIMGLEPNRALCDSNGNMIDIVMGTFFVCGLENGDFVSLSPTLMDRYKKLFLEPEIFMLENGKVKAQKCKKSISEQIKEGAKKASEYHTDHPTSPSKDKKDLS